jgi:hypothetical protein
MRGCEMQRCTRSPPRDSGSSLTVFMQVRADVRERRPSSVKLASGQEDAALPSAGIASEKTILEP